MDLIVSTACLIVFASAGVASESAARAEALGIPTLDEMAGEWLDMSELANPPAIHNFNQMLVVDRDLTSYFCNPGGLYPWNKGYPMVKLRVDGREYPAKEARCYAYKALRRNLHCSQIAVETDTRMINEQRGVLCAVTATNTAPTPRTFSLSLRVPGILQPDGVGVVNTTQRGGTTSCVMPSRKPDAVKAEKGEVVWEWKLTLPSGGKASLGFVAGDNGDAKAAETQAQVAAWASNFDTEMAACQRVWEDRWADAFTPGNPHFSGHLPVLESSDTALKRNYYMGAQTMLALERTQFPVHPRSFITSGERADGTQYFWDATMQATSWALLEPQGMKATLRRWLVQNPRNSAVIDIRQTKGFDGRQHKQMGGYAFSACNLFQAANDYLRITGDLAFLDEKLENGKTVLECMDGFATDWETLPANAAGLRHYGENPNLLECAPAYIHFVPSLNAQNVGMMRSAAAWHALRGNDARAAELRAKAEAFLPTVMQLYKAGDGVWNAWHADGKQVELRHCVDFIYIGNAIEKDLSPAQKTEMNAFVKRELMARDWLRAMSQKDAAAAHSDRPDHGPMGAFDGWIPLTVGVMWRLGDPKTAYDFYARTAAVTAEGPFAQAREFYGPTRDSYDAPVRVAARGGCMKECISGASFNDVVINTFFGFSPDATGKRMLADPQTPRPFTGTLRHVAFQGHQHTLTGNEQGVKETRE